MEVASRCARDRIRQAPRSRRSIARPFIHSKLTPLLLVTSILLGAFAVWKLPREEEPQIVVPMSDITVRMPGASAKEIEQRVTTPSSASCGRSQVSSICTRRRARASRR